jgi:hypothetical protein
MLLLVLVLQAQEGSGAGKGLSVSCTQRKMAVLQVHLRNVYDILQNPQCLGRDLPRS